MHGSGCSYRGGGTELGASLTCCTTFHPVQLKATNNSAAMMAAVLSGFRRERFSVGIKAEVAGCLVF
jgi:hypothetical protein